MTSRSLDIFLLPTSPRPTPAVTEVKPRTTWMCEQHILFAVSVLALVFGSPVRALSETVTLPAVRDNTLIESAGGALSNGEGDHFFAGRTGQLQDSIRRGLVAFDISAVPAESTIDSVAVTLHMSRVVIQGAPQQVGLHRCGADWGEGTSHAFGEEGQGAPADSGDATWIHRFFDASIWASAGGDFQPLPSATASVVDAGFYTWSTNALMADVQNWVNDPSSNFGWAVIGNEGVASTTKRFDSKDHDSTNVRPQLFVSFTFPTNVAGAAPPRAAKLHPNYPNPFNPGTRISYELPISGAARVRVYDISGGLVRTLVDADHDAGPHTVLWNGTSDNGTRVASGVYVYVLQTKTYAQARRMHLIR